MRKKIMAVKLENEFVDEKSALDCERSFMVEFCGMGVEFWVFYQIS
jgi:hypothetical protein